MGSELNPGETSVSIGQKIGRRWRNHTTQILNYLGDQVRPVRKHSRSNLAELREIQEKADSYRNDISDHLVTMFCEAVASKPKLIVELGVRSGESTFVFERVAKLFEAKLVSCDIEDCSRVSPWRDWVFVEEDDITFAARFPEFCKEQGVEPSIDVLFIDTSHLYDHTCQEIDAWFPHLAPNGKVMFHDSNQRPKYRRRDGSRGVAWDNQRGVIRAIERHFNCEFDENRDFLEYRDGWVIRHHSVCSGFTILERVGDVG